MGPSLNPPAAVSQGGGEQPVMTFRPPGATPIAIRGEDDSDAVTTASSPAHPTGAAAPATSSGGGKTLLIVLGVAVLAAAGVAAGWFLTQ